MKARIKFLSITLFLVAFGIFAWDAISAMSMSGSLVPLATGLLYKGPVMAITLASIDWADGSDNTAGLQRLVQVIKWSDISTMPVPTQTDSSGSGAFADLSEISDDIILKPNAVLMDFYITPETGELMSKLQGELDGKSFLNTIECFHPGNKKEVMGFAQMAKNTNFLLLVKDADGDVRLLGHEGYPAKVDDIEIKTGKTPTDRKGSTFKFKSNYKGPAPIFTGNVKYSYSGSGLTSTATLFYAD